METAAAGGQLKGQAEERETRETDVIVDSGTNHNREPGRRRARIQVIFLLDQSAESGTSNGHRTPN